MPNQQIARKGAAFRMAALIWQHRKVLLTTTWVELLKRYSGSVLGKMWLVLYPTLFLCIYLFLFLVIFKVRFPGYSQLDYVVYVFCGLVPYIGFMEALNAGCVSVKQNIHLVRNVLFPIELIPVRTVLIAFATQMVGLGVLLLLLLINGSFSFHVLWLPLVMVGQLLLTIGIVWFLAALAVGLPDVSYFVNLFGLFLMFVSPIGFKADMIPNGLEIMLYLNPIYYLLEMYRSSLLYGEWPPFPLLAVFGILCVGAFVLGAKVFWRFKDVLAVYE